MSAMKQESKPSQRKIAAAVLMCCGVGLWGGLTPLLRSDGALSYEPNIACLKGSPYGKVLALAMQGPIGIYFHAGDTHRVAEHLGNDEEAPPAASARAAEHAEGCGCGAHGHEPEVAAPVVQAPSHIRAKKKIQRMSAYAQRKTDGSPISPVHQRYLQGVTEDKLKLAYELDPSNYTNYGNYHLFLSLNDFGRSDADEDAALALARKTLAFCQKEEVDAATWLTAASAAYNVITHIGRHHQQYSVAEAKQSLASFDFCLKRYEDLLHSSQQMGYARPPVRLAEMNERARFLRKLRVAQGEYMQRMMSQKEKP